MLEPPVTLALVGPLGSGKTTLTKAIARGAGVTSEVTSPTFTLMRAYEGLAPFFHFDFYRVKNALELVEAGFCDLAGVEGMVVVEWADRFREAVVDACEKRLVWIEFERAGEEKRLVRINLENLESKSRPALQDFFDSFGKM
jgi:tRNA threonylcarbamoyladenosine biosynthesis protein TsaE